MKGIVRLAGAFIFFISILLFGRKIGSASTKFELMVFWIKSSLFLGFFGFITLCFKGNDPNNVFNSLIIDYNKQGFTFLLFFQSIILYIVVTVMLSIVTLGYVYTYYQLTFAKKESDKAEPTEAEIRKLYIKTAIIVVVVLFIFYKYLL